MPFCGKCGQEILASQRFCRSCGTALLHETDTQIAHLTTGVTPQTVPYHISSTRVLLMMVLSYGSYLFYWFYVTWKQHRDHTQAEAYPVWHALTLFVPIYSLFRTHAHVRSFKELMLNEGQTSNLSTGSAVLLMFTYWVLGVIGLAIGWGNGGLSSELTQGAAVGSTVTGLISIAVVTWLVMHVQGNLNRYWGSLANMKSVTANVGIGEVFFVLLGLASWGLALASLVSPAV